MIVILDSDEIDLAKLAPRLTAVSRIRLPRAFTLAVVWPRRPPDVQDDFSIRRDIEIGFECVVAVKRNREAGDRRTIERVIRVGPVLTSVVGESHMNHAVRAGVPRCAAITQNQRAVDGPFHGRPPKPTAVCFGYDAGFEIRDFKLIWLPPPIELSTKSCDILFVFSQARQIEFFEWIRFHIEQGRCLQMAAPGSAAVRLFVRLDEFQVRLANPAIGDVRGRIVETGRIAGVNLTEDRAIVIRLQLTATDGEQVHSRKPRAVAFCNIGNRQKGRHQVDTAD